MSSRSVNLPSVDALLRSPDTAQMLESYGRVAVTDSIRQVLSDLRSMKQVLGNDNDVASILQATHERLTALATPSLKRVFNLTGTVIHTNLGRAPLADAALKAMQDAARFPANLEYDLKSGKRGDRDTHVEDLICRITGAEAATVVNNNAAAVLLVLSALARRKEVIVSRGELIEIGGSFRIPDIMKSAGCKLVEVGTTNRTHAADFEGAINPKTAMIMKVHMANYRIDGFVAEVPEADLVKIAHAHELPCAIDLGSGTLTDFSAHGLPDEPTPQSAIGNGADLVTFSGDKLLGGPQAGIICGRADLIKKLKKNPMKRALRLDKVTLAGLAATLQLYRDPERLLDRLPVLHLLTRDIADIRGQANRLLPIFQKHLEGLAKITTQDCQSQIGSGSLPIGRLPSIALSITPATTQRAKGKAVAELAAAFRSLPIPIIGRLSDGALLLDLRCLKVAEESTILEQLNSFSGIYAPSR
jgi:L-seryl-tRNA(Ser) seleniumtransferase